MEGFDCLNDVCEHFILIYRYVRFAMVANEITFHYYDDTNIDTCLKFKIEY